MRCPSLHFQLFICVLAFTSGYTTAQICTAETCSTIDVIYLSSVIEPWYANRECPPDLYSGRNGTEVTEGSDFSRPYYFYCTTCYGVVEDFASCRCTVGLANDDHYVLTCDKVKTSSITSVTTPISITTQTTVPILIASPTAQRTTSTTKNQTSLITTTPNSTSNPVQNVTVETRQEPRMLVLLLTVPFFLITALACIVVITIVILVMVQKRRKKLEPPVTTEPVYAEIAISSLYSELPDPTQCYYTNMYMTSLSLEDEKNQIDKGIEETTYQVFNLNNASESIIYGLIYENLASDHERDDPWYEKDLQMRRLPSSVNSTGTVAYLTVPSHVERNSCQSDSTVFEHYGNTLSVENPNYATLRDDSKFADPPDTNVELYDKMSSMELREINPHTVRLTDTLGTGEFGSVLKAVWDSPLGEMEVAAKVLKEIKDDENGDKIQTAFLQEAAILGQFSHPNILRLVGVVTLSVPNMIVTELMQEELRRFLVALQTQHNQDLDYQTVAPHFLSFSRQVANGMQHLAERGCIHRDIAARNILLTDRCVCKIADFGMSRRLEAESDYYRVKGSNKLPVKWTAPEAVFFKRYTLKSDVWSYGMLLYEIWSVGRKPWPYEDNRSTVEKMARGVSLPPPAGCPRAVYEVMVTAWNPTADQRPDMRHLVTLLSQSDETLLDRGQLVSEAPAFRLGADPIAAEELYKDLQNKHLNKRN